MEPNSIAGKSSLPQQITYPDAYGPWMHVPQRKPKGTGTSHVINKHPLDVKTTTTSSRYAALNSITMDELEVTRELAVISHAGKVVKEIANSNYIAFDYHLNPSSATLTIGGWDWSCLEQVLPIGVLHRIAAIPPPNASFGTDLPCWRWEHK
ncbi:hypothetical protein V6N11_039798 [Hibiscus sabdariffa]|uniref:Uncharacterized protein n=1 Tax=Hibiscus sabdariffa TaxID=183260 RepID=A0ABR2RFI8_9ROSI